MSRRSGWSTLGHRVYGVAAIALGIVGLVWRDFATVWQPVPDNIPMRWVLASATAILLLAAGAAIQSRPAARGGAAVLTVLYFIFALLWLPRVVGFPLMIGTWLGFTEQLALAVAGVIVYASAAAVNFTWASRAVQISRVFFGLCVVTFALAHFVALRETTGMVPKWIPPGQQFWAIVTGVAHLLAGTAIITGRQAALASHLLTAMLISFGVLVWVPMLVAQPGAHMMWAGNAINLAMVGAAWVVADSIEV